jgi:hypothetical protein
MTKAAEPLQLGDFEGWQKLCREHADDHCRRAWSFAGFKGTLILLSALSAAVAAVTSAAGVPSWITTASAGLAAALAALTTGFAPEAKNEEHRRLAAGFSRAAMEFALAREVKASPGRWTVELTSIVGELRSNTFESSSERWVAAQVPDPKQGSGPAHLGECGGPGAAERPGCGLSIRFLDNSR